MCNLCSCSKCKVSPGLANLPEPQRLPAVASDLRSSRGPSVLLCCWSSLMYFILFGSCGGKKEQRKSSLLQLGADFKPPWWNANPYFLFWVFPWRALSRGKRILSKPEGTSDGIKFILNIHLESNEFSILWFHSPVKYQILWEPSTIWS